jgi:hypothetical protein
VGHDFLRTVLRILAFDSTNGAHAKRPLPPRRGAQRSRRDHGYFSST